MKLYDVPRNTKIRLVSTGEEIMFHHIDGMYSYCKTLTGDICHIVAWEEVEIVKEDV